MLCNKKYNNYNNNNNNNSGTKVHGMMHGALDGTPPDAVIWMPSHVKPGGCGSIIRGDGFLLTEIDVRANAEADTLAKRAVEQHRVPLLIRQQVKDYDELTTQNAMWIARATATANNQHDDPRRDTEASRAKAAAAAAARRHNTNQNNTCMPTTYNPQTGKQCTVRVRQVADGGHTIVTRDGGWHCLKCRKRSLTWSRLAPQQCPGCPAEAWTAKAVQRAPTIRTTGRQHNVVVSDPVFWCSACGAYGETAPKLLTQPCRGPQHRRRDAAAKRYGMREQLRCLRRGKHPKTLQSLPPPIPIRQWEAINANMNNQPPDDTLAQQPPPNITDDGTSFTQAFLRRGRPD